MADELIEIFAQALEVDSDGLNDDSAPGNVPQWDSLAAMKLVVAIEDGFDVQLSTKEIMSMSSIGKARQTLQQKNIKI